MDKKFSTIRLQFQEDLNALQSAQDVELLKVKYLGKKGVIQSLMTQLREASPEERPLLGKKVNELKEEITALCENAVKGWNEAEVSKRMEHEALDLSMPGRQRYLSRKHPLSQIIDEVVQILVGMGFSIQVAPDIDSDWYNFEALNFPPDHPAREMQDTFYLSPTHLLRTHTSNVQVRVMEKNRPPIRIVSPGACFRNEDISSRSHVVFHQYEMLYIDKGVTFADLFATYKEFLARVFNQEVEVRFRPSFFPFVEPGVEIDLRCTSCGGKGCRLCKQSGWLEITGAGMVHPEVLRNGGIDPEVYSGYASGGGIERLAMLRWGINDIRLFFENDQRFLEQF